MKTESLVGKRRAARSIGEQIGFWRKNGFSEQESADPGAIQKMAARYGQLCDEAHGTHPFFPLALPKDLFSKEKDANFLWNFFSAALKKQDISLCGKENFLQKDEDPTWRAHFEKSQCSQKGDFVILLGQFGHDCPYCGQKRWVSLREKEYLLPLEPILAILCAQDIKSFWSPDKERWIGSLETRIPYRNGTTHPCVRYCGVDFSTPDSSIRIEVTDIREVLYYSPEQATRGGFASAIFVE